VDGGQTGEALPVSGAHPPRDADVTRLGLGSDFTPTTEVRSGGPLEVGEAFGNRYRIVSLLGMGGMGAVYKAWDQELSVIVALKVVRPEATADPDIARAMERRFKQELLLARKVTHKNVVRIHDLGEVNGIKYITMPFVEGEELAALLKREGKLPVKRALTIARVIASGLAAAHAVGVVHRDLKPANVMISPGDEAMIMDFGIARSTGGGTDVTHTVAGAVIGTVEYMAPEQAKAEEIDHRADIYTFGLILYDMLLGRRRFERCESGIAELTSRLVLSPPRLRSVDPSIPEGVDALVHRCLQPDPNARFQTSAALEAELGRLDDVGRPVRQVRRLTVSLAVAAAVVLLTVVGFTYWVARPAAPVVEQSPISLLIADFENATGDPIFSGAVEQTLGFALETAPFIDVYSRPAAQHLVDALKPGSRIDESVARLLARREGINVIVAGSIVRDGSGFRISLRAIDPGGEEGGSLAEVHGSASRKEQVLETLATLAGRLRGSLGDTAPESVRLAAAETFTTSSPEAMKSYTVAQDLLFAGRTSEALAAYKEAIAQDSQFGRAYSGAGIAALRLGRDKEGQEYWKTALSLIDRMTDRERYRTLAGYYLGPARNYEMAIENFRLLADKFPADRSARASLALAYFRTLNFPRALEEGRRAVDLDPKSTLARVNYALYAMYAGEFETAVAEADKVIAQQPTLDIAFLPPVAAALIQGDQAAARQAYEKMARTGTSGVSYANMGMADLLLFEGNAAAAQATLEAGIETDRAAGNKSAMAAKYVALAEAHAAQNKTAAAVEAAEAALTLPAAVPLQVQAATILLQAGRDQAARTRASELAQELDPQARAYAKILEARIAMRQRRTVDAVEAVTAAQKLADVWLARVDLGIAYVEAGRYAEGLSELEKANARRGEATAIGLDEIPTFRYLAVLPYWLARAQQGLGLTPAARANYERYLKAHGTSNANHPVALDARKRLNAL
jgi:tetratricopeptide (TPR) repeat protein/tRNA A-37 threonylcarbamoyl transferase component Bud32